MIYSFEDRHPKLEGKNIFIADSASVIGSVVIENNVCILPQVVIRGDNATIHICENTNIQDGAIIHTDPDMPIRIGRNVTIAHKAVIHGCNIDDGSVVAIGAIILNGAVIGKNCVIGSNALILENQKIPDGSLVVGSPGKVIKTFSEEEIEKMKWFSKHYVDKTKRFKDGLKLLDINLE